MALSPINDNYQLLAPKQLDNRWGRFSGGAWRPYNDMSEFMTIQAFGARYETQLVFVRSTINSNRSNIFILDKNKEPYLLIPEVDLTNYYNKDDINGFNDELSQGISTAQNSAQNALNAVQSLNDSLKPVAKSGSYNDLSDKPSIPGPAPVTSVNTRTGDITGLAEQQSLNNEITARENADESLGDEISQVQLNVTNEATRAIEAEQLLQPKTDNGLSTASKSVVPAINEVKSKADGADAKATVAQEDIDSIELILPTKAPLASPALTGTPTAPTPPSDDNTTKLATTQFVTSAVSAALYTYNSDYIY